MSLLAFRDCTTQRLLDLLEDESCVVSAAHLIGYLMSNKDIEICIRNGYLSEDLTLHLDAYEVLCNGMTHYSNR